MSMLILVVSARTAKLRDEALNRAKKLSGTDILFVGERTARGEKTYGFVYLDKNPGRPAVDVLGYGQYPDAASYESVITVTASAKVEIKVDL